LRHLEARLRDAVGIAKEHPIVGRSVVGIGGAEDIDVAARPTVALAQNVECPGDIGLHPPQPGTVFGIDGRDYVQAIGAVEGSGPIGRCTFAEIAELQRAFCHALDELGRKGLQHRRRQTQRAHAFEGDTDIEADFGSRVGPECRAGDGRHAAILARHRASQKAAGGGAIFHFQGNVPDILQVAAIALEDIALDIAEIKGLGCGFVDHQPSPNLLRIWAAEKPG